MTAIKICGVTIPAALEAAARATHVGFVFYPPSPRHLTPAAAAALAARTSLCRVGVFVDPDDALLEAAISAARLDAVQLHGCETPERARAVAARHGIEVWKAVPVRTRADLAAARRYKGAAHRLLFDAKAPSEAALPGGNGLRFDWRLLSDVEVGMPWGLSGGLDASGVAEAIRTTGARLVDVSSGVEDSPGVKSPDKIRAFIAAARAA